MTHNNRRLIPLGIFLGLALPLFATSWYALNLQRESIVDLLEFSISQKINVLTNGLQTPIWTLDPESGLSLVESAIEDPVILSIEVTSVVGGLFLSAKSDQEYDRGDVRIVSQDILHNGEKIGELTITVDTAEISQTSRGQWRQMVLLLSLQLILSVGIVYLITRAYGKIQRDQALSEMHEKVLESEALLSSFMRHSPGKMHAKDIQGRYIVVNAHFAELIGKPANQIIGKTTEEILERNKALEFIEHDKLVLSEGKSIMREETFYFQNEDRTYLTVKFPLRNVDGEITGVAGSGIDMTDRKTAEQALVDARNELEARVEERTQELKMSKDSAEAASRAKSEFLSTMSHELRTPLNAIIGFADTISSEVFGKLGHENYYEYVNDIHASGMHLLALINDILDVSAIEAGKLELNMAPVNIMSVIDKSIRLITPRADKKSINLFWMSQTDQLIDLDKAFNQEAGDFNTLQMIGDDRRLVQILVNLLGNSVKFTPESGEIWIKLARGSDQALIIEIGDRGIGMSPDEITIALERFGQVDSRISRQFEGTGLGLPLTKHLVELHGGILEIRSEKHKGTKARISFPESTIVH